MARFFLKKGGTPRLDPLVSDVPTLGNSDTDPVASPQNGRSYWAALKHRKVMGVGITVPVVVRIAIEVAAAVPPQLGIPERTSRLVTLVLLIGFPIALIITMVVRFDFRLSLLEDESVSGI